MIAVVDDDVAIARSLERLLRSSGFETQAFTSASAFLSSGRLNDTRCLVVDVHMPGQSGLDLQDHLRSEGCRLPVIFITGHIDDEARERAFKAGAADMLEKPFDDIALIDRITNVVIPG